MAAKPNPRMSPAHQGKPLPDAVATGVTTHVAVLLLTVRLKVVAVPADNASSCVTDITVCEL